MYALILFIGAAICIPLGYYLIALGERMEQRQKEKPTREGLVKFDRSKDWVYSDVDEGEFVDWEEVE